MKSLFRVAGVLAVSVGGIGCGSNAPANPGPDAMSDTMSDTMSDAGVDLSSPPTTDASPDGSKPSAMVGAGSIRIVPGQVSFLSSGGPCSNDSDPKAEIWCAILTPASESPGMDALFAVNITRALAGVPLSCTSPIGDPNCLLLTRGFAEDSTHKAGFQGSTLLYFDQTGVGYGWRPGMLNGRRLTSGVEDVHDCIAGKTGDVVACVHDIPTAFIPGTTIATQAVFSELVAGHLGPGSPPLAVVDTVISSDPTRDGTRFQMRLLSPLSDTLAWSNPPTPGAPEVLKVQKVGDAASQRVVASGVSHWLVPPDGLHWVWLKDFDYDGQPAAGTLQIAPFSADASAATTLMPNVANVYLAGSSSLAALQAGSQGGGQLSGIVDPVGNPTVITSLDSGVIGVIGSSAQGHLAYAKTFDFIFGLIDLHVKKVDGAEQGCLLDFREEVPYGAPLTPRFLPSGRDIIWSRVTNLDDPFGALRVQGRITRLSDCITQNVTNDIGSIAPLGDEGLTFSDAIDDGTGTLSIRQIKKDGTLASESTVIQTRATGSLSLYPFAPVVVYSVNIGDPADGLYLHPVVFPAN